MKRRAERRSIRSPLSHREKVRTGRKVISEEGTIREKHSPSRPGPNSNSVTNFFRNFPRGAHLSCFYFLICKMELRLRRDAPKRHVEELVSIHATLLIFKVRLLDYKVE